MAVLKLNKKVKSKEKNDIKEIISEAWKLNNEIKEREKKYIKDLKSELEKAKNKIKRFYELTFLGKSKKVEKYELNGLNGELISLDEDDMVDPRKLWEAIGGDIDMLLDILSITKKQAEQLLPKATVEECLVKNEGKVTIRFK